MVIAHSQQKEVKYMTSQEIALVQEQMQLAVKEIQVRKRLAIQLQHIAWPPEAYQPEKTETDDAYLEGIRAGMTIAQHILEQWLTQAA